ncbi:MAG: hypothetical protein ACJ8HU_06245 [Chthoniobacterales bacterium]
MNYIELITGISPDGGSGLCEIALIALAALTAIFMRRTLQPPRA